MVRKPAIRIVFLFVAAGVCWAGSCAEAEKVGKEKQPNKNKVTEKGAPQTHSFAVGDPESKVDVVLDRLKQQTEALKSYQCRIEYRFAQPLLESETVRTGMLFYKREGKTSKLRINFETLKQDDEEQQKYIEQFIFDGVWLIQIDYQLESVRYDQIADINEPIDVFDFAAGRLPLVGLGTDTEDLKKEFEIQETAPNGVDANRFEHLYLKRKKGSAYKDGYKTIEFWIDKKSGLPVRIIAVNPEGDIYDTRLVEIKINKKLKNSVFQVETPDNFDIYRMPLKSKRKRLQK